MNVLANGLGYWMGVNGTLVSSVGKVTEYRKLL